MPKAEAILWGVLKGKNVKELRFRRQYSIGPFIVDFYCPEIRLVIELDGPSHFDDEEVIEYDQRRQKYIERLDITVLRFNNTEIYNADEQVVGEIMDKAEELKTNKKFSPSRGEFFVCFYFFCLSQLPKNPYVPWAGRGF